MFRRSPAVALALAPLLACSGLVAGEGEPGQPGGAGAPGKASGQPGDPPGSTPATPGSMTPGSPGAVGTPGPSGMTGPGPLPPVPTPAACKSNGPGPSPLRRLTRREYGNTVRDLLGATDNPAAAFTPDAHALGFDNIASSQSVSQLLAEQYDDAAIGLAAAAIADLPKLLKCDPMAMGEDACVRKFVADFGLRAYRRPVTTAEQGRLVAFYMGSKAKYGFAPAVELLVQAFLSSPNFLYRPETSVVATSGTMPAAPVRLSAYETASRLSYLFWGSMPDDALFQAAAENKLGTPAELATAAERLLADPRARASVAHFHTQWLELEGLPNLTKDAKANPNFKAALLPLWKREIETFLDDWAFKADGKLETLLLADYTFANKTLSAFYGYAPLTSESTFVKIKHDGKRLGLLTQAALMARHANPDQSSPVHRGKFIREAMLCQDLPPPPNDIDVRPPPIKAGQTTRERFGIHTQVASCAGCHKLIDPVGFAYEHFDAIGQYREEDQGKPVDANAELFNTDVDGTFTGALELSRRLARSDMARGCVITQWFRFASGRQETAEDECSLALLKEHYKASGYSVRKLLLALTQTNAFLFKSAGGAP